MSWPFYCAHCVVFAHRFYMQKFLQEQILVCRSNIFFTYCSFLKIYKIQTMNPLVPARWGGQDLSNEGCFTTNGRVFTEICIPGVISRSTLINYRRSRDRPPPSM